MASCRLSLHTALPGLMVILLAVNAAAAPRIIDALDETKLVTLKGQTHLFAVAKYDRGVVADSLSMEHMYLQLRRSPEQETALEQAAQELQDPHSSKYHQWLTAEQLGKNYGPAQQDIDTLVAWLSQHGFQVNAVHKNGLTLDISGTAGQVREAFHTEIHKYLVNGEQHIANASDPQIPAALSPVVAGFAALNDFMPKSQMKKPKGNFTFPCTGCPDGFNGLPFYDVAPADLATIYNVAPLYTASTPITGKGQTIVVLEDTDIKAADVASFRKAFGLASYSGTFTQIHPGTGCKDPGLNADEGEAALDAEWAGAVAPDAAVELASCADTLTTFGGFIAAQALLDLATPPPIISVSYGECEVGLGPAGNAYVNALWQQAAVEGVSVFVAAGDGGPAGCDNFDLPVPNWAITGIAASGFASTPYNIATGGTDFIDTAENLISTYWSATNTASGKSAKSYVPEMTWNDSCGSNVLYEYFGYANGLSFCNSTTGADYVDLGAGSGAPSLLYAKPYWQKNIPGIPNDGVRDLPDVSLFASNAFWYHALLFCMSDTAQGGAPCDYSNPTDTLFNSAGGTSFTAPQFASIQALINQKAGVPQGDIGPILYSLARTEYGTISAPNRSNLSSCNSLQGNKIGSSCIFHDISIGNINEPCYGLIDCYDPSIAVYGLISTSDSVLYPAYPATTGWDFATGLGSVNVTNLVNSWP